MGRSAAGVRGIRLKKGDEVVGMDVIGKSKIQNPKSKNENENEKRYLLVVMENGYGKRTDIFQYKVQGRGGAGIKTAKITTKTGGIIMSCVLHEEPASAKGSGEAMDLIVISQHGQVIRTGVKSISLLGRATQGVRIMRLEEGDKVASGACLKD